MTAVDEAPFQALPVPDADTAPFWSGCAEHRLLLQRCDGCSNLRFPPAPVCHRCRSWEFSWQQHDGAGRVHAWVTVHHPIPPSIAAEVPYVSALIELDAGVLMPARLVDVEPDAVTAGMPVEVAFKDVADGISLPVFRPAAGPG